MRINIAAIFLLFLSWSFANEGEATNEVWIDGSSFYKSISHKKKSTIYFHAYSPYVRQFMDDDSYYVAMQLDAAFDPIPDDAMETPTLTSLAAIDSDSILYSYFTFLERWGRTSGINYMILPDTLGLSVYEKQVLEMAAKKSPYYFLPTNFLSYSIPESRKDFASETSTLPTIWIVNQDQNLSKVRRWSSKYLEEKQFEFFESLREARDHAFIPTYSMHESLISDIIEHATMAIDPHNQFPIREEKVCYIGSDAKMRAWFSRYATVLDKREEGVLTIVDNRREENKFLPSDIVITSTFLSHDQAQLVLPIEGIDEEVTISQMLFGARAIPGRHNHSRAIHNYQYLGYSMPEIEGVGNQFKQAIDTLASKAIRHFATPGMQVAVLKNGSLIWENNYGHFTYDSTRAINNETLYDIASLTKVMATLPAIARLIDKGLLSLDDSVSRHLPEFSGSNKARVTVRQLMAHNGGLRSYIPFWSMMMTGDRLDAFYYKTPEDEANDIRTYGLEPHPILLDTLKSFIIKSDLIKNTGNYNYSDLGFMVLHLIVEAASGMPFDQFLKQEFYEPMGMKRTTFNPKSNGFSFEEIAPTEYDQRYRNYQVWGEVHDRNALVFGGVAGHAGLFSTASDMAKMMSMLLNEGYYGGKQYLSPEVLRTFNYRYFDKNRRGLGWDKKDGDKDSASIYASDDSFGHTGFTGTMVWADPQEDLIFVFLSNRIYPDAENWRLGDMNTRTLMHDAIYQSIK